MTTLQLLVLRLLWTSAHLGLRARGKPATPDQKAWSSARWDEVMDITVALGCPPAPQTAPWLDRRRR